MNPSRRIRDWLAAPLCWTFVVCLAIASGFVIHSLFPQWPRMIPWTISSIVLILGIVSADWVWRLGRWVSGGSRSRTQPPRTPEQLVADILSSILTQESYRYSDVVNKWPIATDNPLILQAQRLLQECVDQRQDKLDQGKINHHLSILVDIRNRLCG